MVLTAPKKQKNQVCKQKKLHSLGIERLEESPGTALSVGGTVARKTSSELWAHLMREKSCVFEQQNSTSAAFINAILVVLGMDSAVRLRSFLDDRVPH